ncbi:MAG: hypothetical protein ACK4WH_03780 [Phycisphaerales bacterium]
MGSGHAYLTVVDWPGSFGHRQRVESLVAAVGLDPCDAEQRVVKPTPLVAARMAGAAAHSAADVLHRMGVTAFVLSEEEIDAAAAPVRLKRLEPAVGAARPMCLCEPWRAEPFGLICDDLFLIVRATLRTERAGQPMMESRGMIAGPFEPMSVVKTAESRTTHVMDLWLKDRRRLRIDGEKFNFEGLGDARGHSDLVNCDRLALILARSAPRALIDTAFERFSAPPGVLRTSGRRIGLDGRTFRQDGPLFEFYSVWAEAMYRRMAVG